MQSESEEKRNDRSTWAFACAVHNLEKEIAQERIPKEKEQVETIKICYRDFLSMLPLANPDEYVFLSIPLVSVLVKSYYDSIYRYKVYSKALVADVHKQAAYLFKWVAKVKPIQLRHDAEIKHSGLTWINSYFAVHCALTCLFEDSEDVAIFGRVNSELYDNLVYQAQYRNVSGRAVAAQMCEIQTICEQQARMDNSPSWYEKVEQIVKSGVVSYIDRINELERQVKELSDVLKKLNQTKRESDDG